MNQIPADVLDVQRVASDPKVSAWVAANAGSGKTHVLAQRVLAGLGLVTLVTGSIWARISWGVWWSWSERQLVLFLILFLFYSAYFMLRYSLEPAGRADLW